MALKQSGHCGGERRWSENDRSETYGVLEIQRTWNMNMENMFYSRSSKFSQSCDNLPRFDLFSVSLSPCNCLSRSHGESTNFIAIRSISARAPRPSVHEEAFFSRFNLFILRKNSSRGWDRTGSLSTFHTLLTASREYHTV